MKRYLYGAKLASIIVGCLCCFAAIVGLDAAVAEWNAVAAVALVILEIWVALVVAFASD